MLPLKMVIFHSYVKSLEGKSWAWVLGSELILGCWECPGSVFFWVEDRGQHVFLWNQLVWFMFLDKKMVLECLDTTREMWTREMGIQTAKAQQRICRLKMGVWPRDMECDGFASYPAVEMKGRSAPFGFVVAFRILKMEGIFQPSIFFRSFQRMSLKQSSSEKNFFAIPYHPFIV